MARRVSYFLDELDKPKTKKRGLQATWFKARDSKGRFVKVTSRRAVKFELYTPEKRIASYEKSEFKKVAKITRRGKEVKAVLSQLPNRNYYKGDYVELVSSLPAEALSLQMQKPPSLVLFHYWVDGQPKRLLVRLPGGSKFGSHRIKTKFGKKWQQNLRRWLITWLKRFTESAPQSKIKVIGFEPFWQKLGDKAE